MYKVAILSPSPSAKWRGGRSSVTTATTTKTRGRWRRERGRRGRGMETTSHRLEPMDQPQCLSGGVSILPAGTRQYTGYHSLVSSPTISHVGRESETSFTRSGTGNESSKGERDSSPEGTHCSFHYVCGFKNGRV